MEKKKLTPLKSLKLEDVKNLKIHSTYSSLRRACATNPVQIVPASYKSTNENVTEGEEGAQDDTLTVPTVPTIWYVLNYDRTDPDNTDEQEWVAHTLSSEISRFLLAKSTETQKETPGNGEGDQTQTQTPQTQTDPDNGGDDQTTNPEGE